MLSGGRERGAAPRTSSWLAPFAAAGAPAAEGAAAAAAAAGTAAPTAARTAPPLRLVFSSMSQARTHFRLRWNASQAQGERRERRWRGQARGRQQAGAAGGGQGQGGSRVSSRQRGEVQHCISTIAEGTDCVCSRAGGGGKWHLRPSRAGPCPPPRRTRPRTRRPRPATPAPDTP